MKKLLAIIICLMLVTATVMSGCGKKNPSSSDDSQEELPVITLDTDERNFTVNYVYEWEIPSARCKSTIDKKRLDVAVTANGPEGSAVVEDGYLKPAGLGEYTVFYNAQEKDGSKKAKEVKITVTFEDKGPNITLKNGINGFQNISNFTKFTIPEFNDVARLSYDLKGWTEKDFTITKTATYKEDGGEEVAIEDVNAEKRYNVGTITTNYQLTANEDNKLVYTYKFVTRVGDVLMTEFHDRGEAKSSVEIEKIEDKSISDKPIVKFSAPFPVEDFGWPGAKIMAPSGLFDALNEAPDQALVFNCYNPTQYWGKFYCSVYDDKDFTGLKGNYGRKYRVAPHSYFSMVVPKNVHKGNINIIDIVIEDHWPLEEGEEMLPEGELQEKPVPNEGGWRGTEIYILSAEIVAEDESITEKVWEDTNMPLLKVYTDQGGTTESDAATVEKYTSDTLNGLKVIANPVAPADPEAPAAEGEEVTTGSNIYLDFLSDPERKQFIMDEFANVRREHKYNRFFAFKVTNLDAEKPLNLWAMLGNDGNQVEGANEEGKTNWLYERVIPAGETLDVYYNADTRNDMFDLDKAINCIRLNTDQLNAQFVISDVRIISYPVTHNIPTPEFEIKEIEGKHTDSALRVDPSVSWTAPAFETLFTTNFEVNAKVEDITFYTDLDGVGEVVDTQNAINTKDGYYDVTYSATEITSGDKYIKHVIFACHDKFKAMERPEVDKVASYGEHYEIPAFDDMFIVESKHTAEVKSVEYRKDETSEFAKANEFKGNVIDVNVGQYKITYFVKSTEDDKTADVSYILNVQNSLELNMFSTDSKNPLDTTTGVDGKPAVILEANSWDDIFYNNPELIRDFNNATSEALLYIRGINLSANKTYICAFMHDLDTESSKDRYVREYPAAGEDFLIVLPRSASKLIEDGKIRLAVASDEGTGTTAGKVAITEVGLTYGSDYTSTKFIEENQATADRFSALGATTTVENGKLVISSSSKNTTIPLWTAETDSVLSEAMQNDIDQKVIAVDVTNDTDTDNRIELQLGASGNDVDWIGVLRTPYIAAHTTQTIYVYTGFIKNMNRENAKNIKYIGLNIGDDSFWINSGKMSYSNFRVIDFANTTNFEINKIAEKHTEEALKIKPGITWNVPQFEDMYTVNNKAEVSTEVSYRANPSAQSEKVDPSNSITTKAGYYDVVYTVKEVATNKQYERKVTFVCLGDFEAMEKANLDKVLAYGEKFTVPEFDTVFDLTAEHTSCIKSVEFRANDKADWNAIDFAGVLLAHGGQYKITYEYTEVAETKRVMTSVLYYNGNAKLETSKFIAGEKAKVEVVDYKGQPAVKYSTTEGWTRVFIEDRDLIEAFNNAGNDAFLVVEMVNMGDTTPYVCGFLGDLVAGDPNGMHHRAVPAKDEVFSFVIPRNVTPFKSADELGNRLHIQLADAGEIGILGMSICYETKENAENILKIDNALVDTVKANATLKNGEATYSFSNGEIVISTTSSDLVWQLNKDAFPTLKAGFEKFVAGRNHMAIAVDVHNTTDADHTFWFGMGRGKNEVLWGSMRAQVIPANTTKTVYLTNSMVMYNNDTPGGVVDYIHINMDSNSGTLGFANFRVVDLSK